MAITNFNTQNDYESAGLPTSESRVALVESTNDVKIDGVNVITQNPVIGDAVFHDGSKVVFMKGGDQLVKNAVPAGYTFVGVVFGRRGKNALVLNKAQASKKYLDVTQFEWTDAVCDGAEHQKTIRLRFGIPNWDTNTSITFTYTASTMAEAAAAIQAAIEAKLEELEAPAATIAEWWAYADGNRVIVQRDNCTDYRFGEGLQGLSNITWGDMPATTTSGFRKNGTTGGILNAARGAAYYSTNGKAASALTADVPLESTDIMSQDAFENSEYCALLRDTYGTYLDYIKENKMLDYPCKLGVFADSFMSAKEWSDKYALASVPTKAGSTKYKYPALNYAYNTTYGIAGLDYGDWFLHGVHEGALIMEDDKMAIINATLTKMSATAISNSSSRWFAQRYNGGNAWFFYGSYGNLYSTTVYNANQAQAVTLLPV